MVIKKKMTSNTPPSLYVTQPLSLRLSSLWEQVCFLVPGLEIGLQRAIAFVSDMSKTEPHGHVSLCIITVPFSPYLEKQFCLGIKFQWDYMMPVKQVETSRLAAVTCSRLDVGECDSMAPLSDHKW